MNHDHESCIWQLWEVTSRFFARAPSQICCQWLVSSPSLFPRLPKLSCTIIQKYLNPLSPNLFSIIEIFQRQRGLESLQNIYNRHFPVPRSISQPFQMVLSLDNGQMLFLQKPSHPYFLPLVEGTKVGLPHPFGKLLQGELRLLQADWGLAFGPTQVRRIVNIIICIAFVIGNIWLGRQIGNCCNICPPWLHSWLK